jgi:transposase
MKTLGYVPQAADVKRVVAAARSRPQAIVEALKPFLKGLRAIGHETGSVAPWLHRELKARGLPVVMLEARHANATLKAQRNKTDKNDARGLAQLVRSGWFREAHVKSEASHRLKLLLNGRRLLKRKLMDIENEIRQSLKAFGKVTGPRIERSSFVKRTRDLVADDAVISAVIDCMLRAWESLWSEYKRLHMFLVQMVGRDELCQRFTAIPGVGPVVALTFRAGIDDPRRFRKSKTVGAHFGLTSRRVESGETIAYNSRISKCGDGAVRTALYEAGNALLTRSRTHSSLKAWGLRIAAKRGHKRAVVAVARKLAVIMHRMWADGSEFRFGAEVETKSKRRGCAKAAPRHDTDAASTRGLTRVPPHGGGLLGGSTRMRRARNLAGDVHLGAQARGSECVCPAIPMATCAARLAGGTSTKHRMDHQRNHPPPSRAKLSPLRRALA